MRKIGIIAVLSMLVVALAAVPAMAAKTSPSGVHFITEPTCTSTQSTAPNGRTTATITCTGGSVLRAITRAQAQRSFSSSPSPSHEARPQSDGRAGPATRF